MNSMQDITKLKGTFKTPTPELSSASRGMYISPATVLFTMQSQNMKTMQDIYTFMPILIYRSFVDCLKLR